jgi:hypothetical protein
MGAVAPVEWRASSQFFNSVHRSETLAIYKHYWAHAFLEKWELINY